MASRAKPGQEAVQVGRKRRRAEVEAEYDALAAEYLQRFCLLVPQPMEVSLEAVIDQLRTALSTGRPIPDDHDWYAHLPPGAVA